MLAQRGIIASYETIRQWCRKFGAEYARILKRRRIRLGDIRHKEISPEIKVELPAEWCFRCLMLLVCPHLHLKSALMPVFLETETCEAKLGRNVLSHRALSQFQQHPTTEAPLGSLYACDPKRNSPLLNNPKRRFLLERKRAAVFFTAS
jgi:hypothetical protein